MQDNRTYIKLFHRMLEWGWYSDTNTFRVFMHILLRANYKPSEYRGHHIPAGACVFGYRAWAKQLGLSVQQVRTAIEHLKSTHEITTYSTNKFTIVQVENWEFCQIEEGESNKQATRKNSKKRSDNTKINTPPNTLPTSKDFIESVEILKKYGYEIVQDNTQITLHSTNKQQTSNTQATPSKDTTNNKYIHIPNIEEVREYVAENNLSINADYFYKYYETAEWKDMNGKQIKNWKLKALNWSKREEDRNGTKPNTKGSTKERRRVAESVPESKAEFPAFKEA